MLVYDPDHRSNVRRLLEHKYFEDLRLKDASWKRHAVSLSRVVSERGDNATEIHPLKVNYKSYHILYCIYFNINSSIHHQRNVKYPQHNLKSSSL